VLRCSLGLAGAFEEKFTWTALEVPSVQHTTDCALRAMPGRWRAHGGGDRGRRSVYIWRWCRRAGERVLLACCTWSAHLMPLGSDGPLPVQLGHGDRQTSRAPRKVEALSGERILMAACGAYHTAACTDSGSVWTWGQGRWGILGHGDRDVDRPAPSKVGHNDGHSFREQHVVMVACGARHTAAVTDQGGLWIWVGSPPRPDNRQPASQPFA